jgi:exoribonuclease R
VYGCTNERQVAGEDRSHGRRIREHREAGGKRGDWPTSRWILACPLDVMGETPSRSDHDDRAGIADRIDHPLQHRTTGNRRHWLVDSAEPSGRAPREEDRVVRDHQGSIDHLRRLRPVPRPQVRLDTADGDILRVELERLRDAFDVPAAFPPEVVAEASSVSRSWPELDATDIDFCTIDPAGARDLDQALHVSRLGQGYRVRYAIADVAAFVTPGGLVDREAHRRGETLYFPDLRVPLHPPVLSENAASLLPGEVRPALLWTIDVDGEGEPTQIDVRRARVRSRDQFDYVTAQKMLDSGTNDDRLVLLREVGLLRIEQERQRGGVDLPMAEQEVEAIDGGYTLRFRAQLPIERWNAQISLLTGMSAAELMLYGDIGILRTLPTPEPSAYARLRRVARALDVRWDDRESWPDVARRLDVESPPGVALVTASTRLLRGAGYTTFDGAPPEQAEHAGVASEYAHVTAPLRRLADRYALEVCASLVAGDEPPEWVRSAMPRLPKEMAASTKRANDVERAVLDLVEATLLASQVGSQFVGVVVDVDKDGDGGIVQVASPVAVRARVDGRPLPLGEQVNLRLVEADPSSRQIRFQLLPR